MTRDILNYQGDVIGQLEMPDDTSEEKWQEKLAQFSLPQACSDVLMLSIQRRRAYCEDLIERLKKKNITEGINALQAMWMHHKMRALPVTFMGLNLTIDVVNLVISGDVEVAVLALSNASLDDMSQPYHWFNQTRVDWIIADMKSFLGWS